MLTITDFNIQTIWITTGDFSCSTKDLGIFYIHCFIPCIWCDSLVLFFKVIGFQESCLQQVAFEMSCTFII